MGYYSDFTGYIRRKDDNSISEAKLGAIYLALSNISGYEIWGESSKTTNFFLPDAKWYDVDANMTELSKRFPDYVFTIEQVGEDGMHWMMMFYNGRSTMSEGRITYPDIDEDYLFNG